MAFSLSAGALGGILIGSSVMFHAKTLGRVTGLSGIIRRAANVFNFVPKEGEDELKLPVLDWFYVAGLVVGGAVLYAIPPFRALGFSESPVLAIPASRTFLAGLLVGVGTAVGCGCTSGHMIVGLARLSKRSIAATATFCATTFFFVNFLKTLDNTIITSALPALHRAPLVEPHILSMSAFAGLLLAGYAALYHHITSGQSSRHLKYVIALYNGFVFSTGLVFSGMTRPERVLGFFNMLFSPKYYDATLFMVAGFAVLPSLIYFQTSLLKEIENHAAPLVEDSYHFPTCTSITPRLIIGSALFGAGWGLAGACPGPWMSRLITLSFDSDMAIFTVATLLGMNAFSFYQRFLASRP